MNAPLQRLPREGLLLLAMLSLGWGLNWVVIKVALTEVPPLYFRAVSLLFGGIGLMLLFALGQGLALSRYMEEK